MTYDHSARVAISHTAWGHADDQPPMDDRERLDHLAELVGDAHYTARVGQDLDDVYARIAGLMLAGVEQGVERARCATKTDTQTEQGRAAA